MKLSNSEEKVLDQATKRTVWGHFSKLIGLDFDYFPGQAGRGPLPPAHMGSKNHSRQRRTAAPAGLLATSVFLCARTDLEEGYRGGGVSSAILSFHLKSLFTHVSYFVWLVFFPVGRFLLVIRIIVY